MASNKEYHPSMLIYLMHHTYPENIPQNVSDTFKFKINNKNNLLIITSIYDLRNGK